MASLKPTCLFHHIEFVRGLWEGRELYSQMQRLDRVLLKSPYLASYIRVLELPDMSTDRFSTYYRRGQTVALAIDEPLSSLMCKVTQVQKLKISCLDWNAMPEYFRQSLRRVLELPSMVFVCIDDATFNDMDDFTDFINHARGLTGLSLVQTDTSWMSQNPVALEDTQVDDNKQRFERRPVSHLTRLDMKLGDNNSVFIDWLLGPRSHLGVSHIHTLHIKLPNTEDDSVNPLLCAIGSSLKHVFISLPHVFPVPINLAFNVNIEILSLVRMDMRSDTLSALRRALSTVDASNHIHQMELRLDPLSNDTERVCWAAWEEVYSVLAGPHFRFLRVLYINIGADADTLWNQVYETKDMAAAHPLLAARGVRVSFGELDGYQCTFCSRDPWN
ncbi:hypothetical protein JB92DRAFT_3109629 [Gautieria morchelliformis]|nr:hypothetical protein JB92DRAFT_3109629 [Gautieria morchelliformis]